MKNILLIGIFLTILGFSNITNAELQDNGNGLIYDTDLNVTWFDYTRDVDTWQNQMAWVENLSLTDVNGEPITGWRLPHIFPVNGSTYNWLYYSNGSTDIAHNISAPGSMYPGSTASEMAHLFYTTLGNMGQYDVSGNERQSGWGLVNVGPFENLLEGYYWSETNYGPNPNDWACYFGFGNGLQWAGAKWPGASFPTEYGPNYAMAVHDGNVGIPPVQYTLTVRKSGEGSGKITGTGISCGEDCTELVAYGTTVVLTASEDTGFILSGWSGCDSTLNNTCTVKIYEDREVIVAFNSGFRYAQWISVTPPHVSKEWKLNAVHFTSAAEGWAVGYGFSSRVWDDDNGFWTGVKGVLLHYQNGTWTSVTPPDVSKAWDLEGVHFTSPTEGWAVGYNQMDKRGVLLHYQNGTWTSVTPSQYVSDNWYLNAVHFTSAAEGWAVGVTGKDYRGVLLHYQNGTWTSVTPPDVSRGWSLNAVHFTSAAEGWAVGFEAVTTTGLLLHYQNGTWKPVPGPKVDGDWRLEGDVHFTSPTEGWAVGHRSFIPSNESEAVLLHYQNGTWTWVSPPLSEFEPFSDLKGVHFTSPTEGWVVGEHSASGTLVHYQNGTWSSVREPSTVLNEPLNAVHFTSPTEGWAVGDQAFGGNGVLLHYIDAKLSPSEGTIGTQLTITGSFGAKKGNVLIGGVATKVAKDGWKPHSIAFTPTKVLPPKTYDVTIKSFDADDFILPNAFTVKPPEIDSLDYNSGAAGTPITITGNFFVTKKGKVYFEYEKNGVPKKKNCKVTDWSMDSITFIVPRTSKSFPAKSYPLKIDNKIGVAAAPSDYTVE